MPCKGTHLVTIGHLSQQFQRHPMDVTETLSNRGVHPTMTINFVAHYDFNDSYRALEGKPLLREGSADE